MIRQPSDNDRAELGKVYCLSWKFAYKNIIPNEYLDSLTIENSTPNKILPENNLVIEENGVIVGVCNFGTPRDKSLENVGELKTIYVLPELWSKGFGRELFTNAVQKMKNLGYIKFYLWVLKDNHRARRFYEKMNMKNTNIERIINIGGKDISEIKYELSFNN